MVERKFIADQVARSRSQQSTSPFLRGFILHVVDAVLRGHYGTNYSDRCLQASVLIQRLLEGYGIRAHVFVGAVCLTRASKGRLFDLGWAGFWDENQHAWVVTEFGELVDLTIAQLHLHPASHREDDEPIPALWWQPIDVWPPIIKYLPEGIAMPDLPAQEQQELEQLLAQAETLRDEVLAVRDAEGLVFGPILHGPDHLQQMTLAGHPWLNKSLLVQERRIPLPDWVAQREAELMEEYRQRSGPC